jgi:chemotaxis protein MotB
MNRRERRRGHINHERWLVSYADFITLLFAFFVVLYASSKADQKKQHQVSQAIDSAFHALGAFTSNSPSTDLRNVSAISDPAAKPEQTLAAKTTVMDEAVLSPIAVKEDLLRVQHRLEKMLVDPIAKHAVSIAMGKDGLVISLREAGFFSSASATPHPNTIPILHAIAADLSKTAYDIRIEGHTDNIPIHNPEFDSNWELSSARATRIARIFIAASDMAPDRISAAGYAEFHPIASNESDAGRAENRRVDLVVIPRTRINLAMPGADSANVGWRRITE